MNDRVRQNNNIKSIRGDGVTEKWKKGCVGAALFLGLLLAGCGKGSSDTASNAGADTASETVESTTEFVRTLVTSVEAENGKMLGGAKAESGEGSEYSGSGYAGNIAKDGDGVTISFSIAEAGFYDLDFYCAMPTGYKENYVSVDNDKIGTIAGDHKKVEASTIPHVWLEKGEHTATVEKYWGFVNVDKLEVMTGAPFDTSLYDVEPKLTDAKASTNAKRLYQYLKDNYGRNIISGQYCAGGIYGHEMAILKKVTGKFPAMVGLDMMEYSPSAVKNGTRGTSIEKAIEAWENNSIVTMCWHWDAPSEYVTGTWYSAFYKEHTNIDLDKIMSGQDQKGYDLLVSDMDAIAKELTKLRDADVPVLWRPLHEASGGWFWWGNCSAESYIKLYRLMHEKFTNEYELHNLIWVWNGQSSDWYPGDEVVDIMGTDIYPGERVYTSQYPKFMEVAGATEKHKIITLSENGCHFDPDLAIRDGAMWSYFGTWSGEFIAASETMNYYSDQYTEEEMLKKVYDHEHVITRDELPVLAEYSTGE